MKQIYRRATAQEDTRHSALLTLYDRYGSMAYGIILRIIPEPEPAQAVLVDLFASPQLKSCAEAPIYTAGEIIRLARLKALSAKSMLTTSTMVIPNQVTNDNTAKLVFDLSFSHGYAPEAIADKLQLSRSNVLKSIYTYFKHLRSS